MHVADRYKNINKPIHIDKLALCWIACQKGYIALSPKADGEYKELKYKNYTFQCEYIRDLDLYLIFDTKSYPSKHNNNIINRNKWIRGLHKIASTLNINTIDCMDQLSKYINDDTELLKQYINTTSDTIKWYPKILFNINLPANSFLSLLDLNYDNVLGYKTDGWILSSLKCIGKLSALNYKYKPHCELTIDIIYINNKWHSKEHPMDNVVNKNTIPNNTIWRCRWNDGYWIPRELRLDKKVPNKQYIINNLEIIHKEKWVASQLIPIVNTYYYNNEIEININDTIANYLQSQRIIFKNNITDIVDKYNIKNILDLGCGKGWIANILHDREINITGIDIDPVNIFILKNKYWNSKYEWIYHDINSFNNNIKYDLIIMNNTIHTITDMEKFTTLLSDMAHNNTILYLHFLNKDDVIKNNIEFIEMINDNLFQFKYPWRTDIINENIASIRIINMHITNHWKLINEYSYNCNDSLFDIFKSCHKYLVYSAK